MHLYNVKHRLALLLVPCVRELLLHGPCVREYASGNAISKPSSYLKMGTRSSIRRRDHLSEDGFLERVLEIVVENAFLKMVMGTRFRDRLRKRQFCFLTSNNNVSHRHFLVTRRRTT